MPTYFLNIRDGADVALDSEGAEYSSLREAREDALASARELSADALRAGQLLAAVACKVFEIRNEAGVLLLAVRFIEALTT